MERRSTQTHKCKYRIACIGLFFHIAINSWKHVILLWLLKQIIEQPGVDMSSPLCLPENSFFFPHSLSRN